AFWSSDTSFMVAILPPTLVSGIIEPLHPASPSVVGKGTSSDAMLMSLAEGLEALDSVGIEYDAALGDVQYYQASGGVPPGGVAVDQLHSFPWHGGDGSVDGAFNAIGVVTSPVA